MKKTTKYSIYIIFSLFFLFSILFFLFIHTNFWQNRLKNTLSKQINENTELNLTIGSVQGNTLNNIKFNNVKLQKDDQTLIKIGETEVGYNLFSVFASLPEINSLYLNNVTIDSLPIPDPQTAGRKINLLIPDLYAENVTFRTKNSSFHSSLTYGEIEIKTNSISFKIDSSNFKIDQLKERFGISNFVANYYEDSISVEDLKLTNRKAQLDLTGKYYFTNNSGTFQMEGKDFFLKNRVPKGQALLDRKDNLNFKGQTDITNNRIHSELNFSGQIRGKQIKQGEANIEIAGTHFKLNKINLQSGNKQNLSGEIEGDFDGNISGDILVNNIDLQYWNFLGAPTDLNGELSIFYKGGENPVQVSLNMRKSNIDKMTTNQITGELTLDKNKFTISDSLKFITDNSQLDFTGEYKIVPKTINLKGAFSTSKPEILEKYTRFKDVSGDFKGTVKILGELGSPVYQGWLEGENISTKTFSFGNTQAQFDLKSQSEGLKGELSLQGKNFLLKYFSTRINEFTTSISIDNKVAHIENLVAKGDQFTLNSTGKITDWETLQVDDFTLDTKDNKIENTSSILVERSAQGVKIPKTTFSFEEGSFSLEGELQNRQLKSLNLDMDNIELAPISKLMSNINFSGKVDGILKYQNKNKPLMNIDLKGKNINMENMDFSDLQLTSQIKQDSILIQNSKLQIENESYVEVEGYIGCNFPLEQNDKLFTQSKTFNLDFNYSKFPLDYFNNYLLKETNFSGELTGNMNFQNTLGDPILNTILKIDSPKLNFMSGKSLSSRIHYEKGSLDFRKIDLQEGNGYYTGSGSLPLDLDLFEGILRIPPQDSLDMQFSAITNSLPFVSEPVSSINNIEGDISLSLSLSGTKNNPVRTGQFTIENGEMNLDFIENTIYDINSSGKMENNILTFNNFTAKLKNEQNPRITQAKNKVLNFFTRIFKRKSSKKDQPNLTLAGTINFDKFFQPSLNIVTKGDNIYFRTPLSEIEGYSDADLSLTGRDTLDIDGEVEISKMFIRKEFRQSEGSNQSQSSQQGPITNINIQTYIPGNLYIRNNQLDCELSGEIWIIKEVNTPWRLSGDLSILGGSFYYFGYEFTNLSGTILFDPVEMNPKLDIYSQLDLASSISTNSIKKDESIIDVHLTGDLERPIFQFESNNYSQNNILNMIASQGNSEESNLPGNALNVFGQYFERQLEREVTRVSGLDKISFQTDANLLKDRNLNNWKITLGQRISPRVFLSYEQGTTKRNKSIQAFELEYRLNNHQFLEGRIDQDGLFGVNYKIRFNY